MNYSVVLLQEDSFIVMLKGSTLDNAIAFASYLFVNSKHDYEVRNQAGESVVRYFKIF